MDQVCHHGERAYNSNESPIQQFPTHKGRHFRGWINQKIRDCEILEVTPTRIRIEYEIESRSAKKMGTVLRAWRARNKDGSYFAYDGKESHYTFYERNVRLYGNAQAAAQ